MIRKPRSLFKARRRGGGALYVGPEFAGPEPHYMPLLDAISRHYRGRLEPGTLSHVLITHDDCCAVFEGGPCDCEPEAEVVDHATYLSLIAGGAIPPPWSAKPSEESP